MSRIIAGVVVALGGAVVVVVAACGAAATHGVRSEPMGKLLAMVVLGVVVLGAPVVAEAKSPARRHAPSAAEVQAYRCAVERTNVGPCQHIPGFWNDWAGRPTPPRWDPCDGATTLFGNVACGPMSPTIRQWCTLHFDHRVGGWRICVKPEPWT